MNQILPYQSGVSQYSSNQPRTNETRRDNDTVKVPKVTLYDIDYAMYYHLTENFIPRIFENGGNRIPVPVMFANGEKWSQIRQHGYLRDNNRKILAPLMTLRRLDLTNDTRINLATIQTGNYSSMYSYRVMPFKDNSMQYDRVAGQYVSKQSYEYYLLTVPNYVRINYELSVWTDLQEQMNTLVQGIYTMNNHMWGDYYTFRTQIDSVSNETINVPGEDRIVKCTMNLLVDGYLREEFEYQQSNIQKMHSIKRIDFLNESTDEIISDSFNQIDNNIPTNNLVRL